MVETPLIWAMQLEPLSESAFIMRDLSAPGHLVAGALRRAGIGGIVDVVAAYDTVAVYVNPEVFSTGEVGMLQEAADHAVSGQERRAHVVPVDYEAGPDLGTVCEKLGIGRRELIERHTAVEYECFAVGFCPGFPYLGPLDERLRLERKPVPSPAVVAGSVAVAGGQTGIYPLVRPGGWWVLGLTPLCLVDVEDGYFPISAGDTVRFESVPASVAEGYRGERL